MVRERGVRVTEKQGYSRAGRHKDRPQSSRKSDLISFIANEASCNSPASISGSPDRSCAVVLFALHLLSCRREAMVCKAPAMGMGPQAGSCCESVVQESVKSLFFLVHEIHI